MENLFDAVYVGTESDDDTVKHNWTKRMVEIKLNHTDADMLGLQVSIKTSFYILRIRRFPSTLKIKNFLLQMEVV